MGREIRTCQIEVNTSDFIASHPKFNFIEIIQKYIDRHTKKFPSKASFYHQLNDAKVTSILYLSGMNSEPVYTIVTMNLNSEASQGVSKRNPIDKWDPSIGVSIAMFRALNGFK